MLVLRRELYIHADLFGLEGASTDTVISNVDSDAYKFKSLLVRLQTRVWKWRIQRRRRAEVLAWRAVTWVSMLSLDNRLAVDLACCTSLCRNKRMRRMARQNMAIPCMRRWRVPWLEVQRCISLVQSDFSDPTKVTFSFFLRTQGKAAHRLSPFLVSGWMFLQALASQKGAALSPQFLKYLIKKHGVSIPYLLPILFIYQLTQL